MKKYSIRYKDKFGIEKTEIYSDGSTLKMTLRDIEFNGIDFDSFEGKFDETKFEYVRYENGLSYLTNFEITIVIPVKIVRNAKEVNGNIIAFIATRNNNSTVRLELDTEFGTFVNEKKYSDFESAIIGIQKRLPDNTKIKTCLSCRFSNYNPLGNGMFGDLNCFKNLKEDIKNIRSKRDLIEIWDKGMDSAKIFNVQETFVCNEHQFVTEDDWVYKNWQE